MITSINKPLFFVVGAPKCGTTALCEYLEQHPQIFMCPVKEPNFFGKDLTGIKAAENLDEYLKLFCNSGSKIAGEGSVWYLFSKTAAKEIYDFNPHAKIIIMLRNPIDVMYSLHNQLVYDGDNEDIEDFELAIKAEKDRKKGLRIPKTCNRPESLLYTEVVEFTEQVKRYFDIFGVSNVKIIVYDDFKEQTLKVYKEVLSFLNVDCNFQPRIKIINPSKRVKSKALQNFLVERPPIVQRISKSILPKIIRYRIFMMLKMLNTQYETRFPMKPALRKQLQSDFQEEIKCLSKLLERDLTYWG